MISIFEIHGAFGLGFVFTGCRRWSRKRFNCMIPSIVSFSNFYSDISCFGLIQMSIDD